MKICSRFVMAVFGIAMLAAVPARLGAKETASPTITEDRKRADDLYQTGKTEEAKII